MIRHVFSQQLKDYILKRDNYRCVYCGEPADEVDHVIPSCDNGPAITSNGVAACNACNARKYNKTEQDMITKALYSLLRCGENIDWMSEHYGGNYVDTMKTITSCTGREITCKGCGKIFVATAPRSQYCSKCRLQKYREPKKEFTKTCEYCGKPFITKLDQQKYCSLVHGQYGYYLKYHPERHPIIQKCSKCEQEFITVDPKRQCCRKCKETNAHIFVREFLYNIINNIGDGKENGYRKSQ